MARFVQTEGVVGGGSRTVEGAGKSRRKGGMHNRGRRGCESAAGARINVARLRRREAWHGEGGGGGFRRRWRHTPKGGAGITPFCPCAAPFFAVQLFGDCLLPFFCIWASPGAFFFLPRPRRPSAPRFLSFSSPVSRSGPHGKLVSPCFETPRALKKTRGCRGNAPASGPHAVRPVFPAVAPALGLLPRCLCRVCPAASAPLASRCFAPVQGRAAQAPEQKNACKNGKKGIYSPTNIRSG